MKYFIMQNNKRRYGISLPLNRENPYWKEAFYVIYYEHLTGAVRGK
jgi:hypothetical protein